MSVNCEVLNLIPHQNSARGDNEKCGLIFVLLSGRKKYSRCSDKHAVLMCLSQTPQEGSDFGLSGRCVMTSEPLCVAPKSTMSHVNIFTLLGFFLCLLTNIEYLQFAAWAGWMWIPLATLSKPSTHHCGVCIGTAPRETNGCVLQIGKAMKLGTQPMIIFCF